MCYYNIIQLSPSLHRAHPPFLLYYFPQISWNWESTCIIINNCFYITVTKLWRHGVYVKTRTVPNAVVWLPPTLYIVCQLRGHKHVMEISFTLYSGRQLAKGLGLWCVLKKILKHNYSCPYVNTDLLAINKLWGSRINCFSWFNCCFSIVMNLSKWKLTAVS